ncbi:hypothetical protein GDO81_023339 [Engystomops pustulosus]|uniref:ATP-dependent Clp protease proteolytic subunit n=1 Tax=Engystomops pustulosus TaxID=76066 RepID=A0AAV6YLL1_ENGPU|nr:hypothetical protein GDO81_023339 [Engystomops pustulosus]
MELLIRGTRPLLRGICALQHIRHLHRSPPRLAPLIPIVVEQTIFIAALYIFAGGSVTAGLAIYDTMQYILNPICTWCVGQAASMGSLLLAAGSPGMRHSLPNSRIMIHQPSGGARGQATDIAIQAEEILKLKKQINDIYAKHTRQQLSVIGESELSEGESPPTNHRVYRL